jgi:hypothetical protein
MLPYSVSPTSSANRPHWTRCQLTLLQSWIVAILLGIIGALYFSPASACFIDGRALSVVEDIDRALSSSGRSDQLPIRCCSR